MRSDFADTLVAAIAGLVVPVDSKNVLKRQCAVYQVAIGNEIVPTVSKAPPRLTRGIQRDGLVPFNIYLKAFFKNAGVCAFASPFARTLRFGSVEQKLFQLPKNVHFKAGVEYEQYNGIDATLTLNEYDDQRNLLDSKKYTKLAGVPLHGSHGMYKATYVVEDEPTLQTFALRDNRALKT